MYIRENRMASAAGSERSSLCCLLVLFSSTAGLVRSEQATALCKGGAHVCPRIQELNEVREKIGADYRDIGICLLNDDDGSKLDAIMDDDRKAKNKLDVIFRRWIKGEGRKCTWDVLCECLKHARLITLAEKVESACSVARDPANEVRSEATTNIQASERTGTTTSSSIPSFVEPNKRATQSQTGEQVSTPSYVEPSQQATYTRTQSQNGEQVEPGSVLQSSTLYLVLFTLIIMLLTTACYFLWKTDTEIPTFGKADKDSLMKTIKFHVSPFEQNELFLNEVKLIVHSVNNNEKWAVLANMEPSENQDEENNTKTFVKVAVEGDDLWLVLGKFGGYKVALLQTEMGSNCGPELKKAMEILPNVKCVIGVGVAFAFKKEYRLGDVLVSKWIAGGSDLKVQNGGIQVRNAVRNSVSPVLIHTFIRDANVWAANTKFKCSKGQETGRECKVYPGGIVSSPLLMDDKKMRDEIYKRFPEAVGGEMEGYMYMKLNDNQECNFDYIIIKGVADYGDGTKNKMWQFTAAVAAVNFVKFMLERTEGKMYS